MALALSIYEDGMTADGLPASVVYGDERGTWLEAKPRINYAEAARQQWHKDNPNPEPGTVLEIVDTWPGEPAEGDDNEAG
ncbi:hypothetical protein [Sanguibacter sp. HDW7]|uniref:hypothetical protein n=1 Tax=Sanguibacter sp. HDW7 TaxID=2714931 RepID=UPI00140B0CAD|nr:hypothetical protein [Sanguibacter sp. HDW7]QIK82394.1 hypothetical protein G7063_01280 [Sanguibacter sp. HDW7]